VSRRVEALQHLGRPVATTTCAVATTARILADVSASTAARACRSSGSIVAINGITVAIRNRGRRLRRCGPQPRRSHPCRPLVRRRSRSRGPRPPQGPREVPRILTAAMIATIDPLAEFGIDATTQAVTLWWIAQREQERPTARAVEVQNTEMPGRDQVSRRGASYARWVGSVSNWSSSCAARRHVDRCPAGGPGR